MRLRVIVEKPSTALSQEADVGVKVEDPARVIDEPLLDLGMLVGGVVVGDGVDDPAGPDGALDGVEELDELLVGVGWHAATDHGPVEDCLMTFSPGRLLTPPRLRRR